MSDHSKEAGFTLIEVLLYVAIFSVIIGGIVSLAFLSTAARAQNQTRADLNYQGEAVMALLVQSIHQAQAITAPVPGSSASSLTLAMSDSTVDPTIFDTVSRSGYNAVEINEGSLPTQNDLTNSSISVSNLKFTNMSVGSTNSSILIQFDLTYNNLQNRPEFDYSQSFSGGATIP